MADVLKRWHNEDCSEEYDKLEPFQLKAFGKLLRTSCPTKEVPGRVTSSKNHQQCLTLKWEVPKDPSQKSSKILLFTYRYTGVVLINRKLRMICLEKVETNGH